MSETIALTRAEYQDLVDARDHAIALRDVAAGTMETLSQEDVAAFLAAATPLAFWRKSKPGAASATSITMPHSPALSAFGSRI